VLARTLAAIKSGLGGPISCADLLLPDPTLKPRLSLLLPVLVALAGCEPLGIESASAVAHRREAEGKAIGAACRHAGRAIEDCFTLNRKIEKAAIYAGWREMNDYMRENDIHVVSPQFSGAAADAAAAASVTAAAAPDMAEAPRTKQRKSSS
jgi:hypothetical protein